MSVKYVSFDPGVTTGVATWDEEGNLLRNIGVQQAGLDALLYGFEQINTIKVFVVEEYRVYASKAVAHIGSKVETAQVIGQISATARRMGIEVVMQPATILNIAMMWAQVKKPKGHLPDDVSAYLHGYYYLHRKGIIKAKVLET